MKSRKRRKEPPTDAYSHAQSKYRSGITHTGSADGVTHGRSLTAAEDRDVARAEGECLTAVDVGTDVAVADALDWHFQRR